MNEIKELIKQINLEEFQEQELRIDFGKSLIVFKYGIIETFGCGLEDVINNFKKELEILIEDKKEQEKQENYLRGL